MSDIATALTNSLDRLGRGGMLAPFGFTDGTLPLPGATWANEVSTGMHREALGQVVFGVLAENVMRWRTGGADIWDGSAWQPITTSATQFWENITGGIEYSGGDITVSSSHRYGTNARLNNTSTGGISWSLNSSGEDSIFGAGNLELSVTSQGPKAILKENGDFTASRFIGDGSLLTNLPGGGGQWDDVAGGIAYTGGNVGIGTTPDEPLHVAGSSSDAVFSRVQNTEAAGNPFLRLGMGGSVGFGVPVWVNSAIVEATAESGSGIDLALGTHYGDSSVKLYTGAARTERMRITSDGNVGIGTDAPTTILETNVLSGNNEIRQSVGGVAVGQIISGVTDQYIVNLGSGSQQFYTGGESRLTIAADGNVGINKTDPATKLGIKTTTGGAETAIRISDDVTQTMNVILDGRTTDGGVIWQNPNVGYQSWETSGTERMRITADGTVKGLFKGTGVTQNESKFEVVSALPGSPDANTIYFVVDGATKETKPLDREDEQATTMPAPEPNKRPEQPTTMPAPEPNKRPSTKPAPQKRPR